MLALLEPTKDCIVCERLGQQLSVLLTEVSNHVGCAIAEAWVSF